MKLKRMLRIVLAALAIGFSLLIALFVLSILSDPDSPKLAHLGTQASHLNKNAPEKIQQIPYRLSGWNTNAGAVRKNTDIAGLILAAQSGEAIGQLALLAVHHCYGPDIWDNLPAVICRLDSNDEVVLAGDKSTRNKLLKLRKNEQTGLVVGKIIKVIGFDKPLIQVL